MKFVKLPILLLLTLCITSALSSNIMRKVTKLNTKVPAIKLAVFGDIGQVDQYEKRVINDKSFLNEITLTADTKRKEKLEEFCIYDSKEDDKENFCSRTVGKDLKKITLTMDNFTKIKQKLVDENATEYVLLGDALYTEAKNLESFIAGATGKVEEFVQDLKKDIDKNIVNAAAVIEKDPDFKKDILEANKNLPQDKPQKLDENAFKEAYHKRLSPKELLDEIEMQRKKDLIFTEDNLPRVRTEYRKRQICGWNQVDSMLKDLNKNNNLAVTYGNHAYDVNLNFETIQMMNYKPWKDTTKIDEAKKLSQLLKTLHEVKSKPKISYLEKDGVKILFLDFDMTVLVCSEVLEAIRTKVTETKKYDDESFVTDFKKCLTGRFAHTNPNHFTPDQQKRVYVRSYIFYLNLLKTLSEMKSGAIAKADWNIIRIHQSIFNIERDFLGVKTNSHLMTAFKDAKIHLWLVSHHHSAQINFGKYETEKYKYLVTDDPKSRLEFNDPIIDDKRIEDETHLSREDYFFAPEDKDGKRVLKQSDPKTAKAIAGINRCQLIKSCTKDKDGKFTNKSATIKINPENTDYIIQLLTGNGGRKLDPLISDLESDSFMLFGRAYPQEFGYYTLEFSKENGVKTAVVNYKFSASNSKNKDPSFSLTIVQDVNTNFESNFVEGFDFTNYLKTKYLRQCEKGPDGKEKDSPCWLQKLFSGSVFPQVVFNYIVFIN
jgi:hypothetical protein